MSPEQDPETGRFLAGNGGNGGRPKGSRNKLGEAFLSAMHADFVQHGASVIERVRQDRPDVYLKVVASILPQQLEVKAEAFDGLSDDELTALIAYARQALAVCAGGGSDAPQTAH